MTYRELPPGPFGTTGGIQRIADLACIPEDGGNLDWVVYLEWLAAGNTPEPWVVPEG